MRLLVAIIRGSTKELTERCLIFSGYTSKLGNVLPRMQKDANLIGLLDDLDAAQRSRCLDVLVASLHDRPRHDFRELLRRH